MKSLSLYELSTEFAELGRLLLESMDEDTGEIDDTFIEKLEASEIAFREKAVNIAKYIENLKSTSEGLKKAIQKQQKRKKTVENMIARLEQYLIHSMKVCEVEKIEGELPIQLRQNPFKLIIEDEELIDESFFESQKVLNKSLLKNFLIDGFNINGAHLEKGVSVRIG